MDASRIQDQHLSIIPSITLTDSGTNRTGQKRQGRQGVLLQRVPQMQRRRLCREGFFRNLPKVHPMRPHAGIRAAPAGSYPAERQQAGCLTVLGPIKTIISILLYSGVNRPSTSSGRTAVVLFPFVVSFHGRMSNHVLR